MTGAFFAEDPAEVRESVLIWAFIQEQERYREQAAEQACEIHNEYAWLRHAETPTDEDLAFADYEARLGLV